MLVSSDLGKDQDAVQGHLKRLSSLKLVIEKFKETIDKLSSLSSGLVDRQHFDSENIQHKQVISYIYFIRIIRNIYYFLKL